MNLGAKPDRNRRIVTMHVEEGLTLSAIGDRVGLTRERVRQIVRRAGVPVEVSEPLKRRAISEALTKPRVPSACEHCGRVERVTVTRAERRRYCSKQCMWDASVIANGDLLDDLRKLGEHLGRTPGEADIIEAGRYSHMTYYRAFGSLQRAQELAGFEPMPPGNEGHRS